MEILRCILKTIISAFDTIFILLCEPKNKNGLALVRLDAIGDFILWLDSAKEYKKLYPNYKITLIGNSIWTEVARKLPFWDEVFSIDLGLFYQNPLYRWRTLRKIKLSGFEVAIHPVFSRDFFLGDSIIRATSAAIRVGSIGDLSNTSLAHKTIANTWYTHLLPAVDEPLMELDRHAEFMRHLSGSLHCSDLAKLPVLTHTTNDLKPTNDYFILFPGASRKGRQWPSSSFAVCLDKLVTQHGWVAVLCGSSSEYEICQSVIDQSNTRAAINLAGHTSLTELVEIVRGARLLIGNETSAVHIAAAVDTPAVCILGGGHFGRFMPYLDTIKGVKPIAVYFEMECYGCNWKCSQPYEKDGCFPCINSVSVQNVLGAAQLALK